MQGPGDRRDPRLGSRGRRPLALLPMLTLGPLAFAAPWLLLALAALPVLVWLLRVTPPAARRQSFPAIRLLRDLPPVEQTPSRTPWWLLLLRIVAAALIILGLSRPIWGPGAAVGGSGPLLVVIDDGWAAAADWPARAASASAALDAAGRDGRRVALLATAASETGEAPRASGLMPADEARARLAALRPKSWAPDRAAALAALAAFRTQAPGPFSAHYVTDGVEHAPGGFAALAQALAEGGALTLARAEAQAARMLMPPRAEADRLNLRVTQLPVAGATSAAILARTGDGRTLARAEITMPAGAREGEAVLELPVEIRNQVVRLDLEPSAGAAGVMLLDERFRRRPVGLLASTETQADVPLIGDLYYLDRALAPFAEIRRGTLEGLLARQLAVLVLADRDLSDAREREAVARWVREGGTLIRFAGPRMAENPDPLLPVPLRAGERQLGGAMTWERAQPLAPFPDGSPFAGLPVPAEILVERQVLAEPSAQLSARSWARLADGTPLVTFETRGAGRVVLFHVTAQAEWSNLPLSGLFVDMLRRLVALSAGVGGNEGAAMLAPLESLDGFGRLGPAPPAASAIAANQIEAAIPSPRQPPGWYGAPGQADDGAAYRRALNLSANVAPPVPVGAAPASAALATIGGVAAERDLGPWLLAAALLLLAVDMLVSLGLRGLLARPVLRVALLGMLLATPALAQTQGQGDGSPSLATRLAYVVTGDAAVDETVRQGLMGLSDFVNRRSAATLAEPLAVVPGQDDLAFFPLLYWTILPDAPAPNAAAAAALNSFMRNGGIILFDTRDEGSGEGFSPGARAALRRVTRELSVPPLAVVADDHVLRRAFYLLQDLPGRFSGGQVWVARDGDRANDSVSPVIVGGHDWAAAWAVDGRGGNPHAVIPGGARQRILAYRFGMNLVIYALTGNYKGDQVHVPAILERLGN